MASPDLWGLDDGFSRRRCADQAKRSERGGRARAYGGRDRVAGFVSRGSTTSRCPRSRAALASLRAVLLQQSPTARATGQPSEEWGIFDYDGFGALRLDEYTPLETVAGWAAGIREHGPAFAAWLALDSTNEAGNFADAYLGEYESVAAYVRQLLEDVGVLEQVELAVPPGLRPYVSVDVEAMAHDLELGGDIAVVHHVHGVWLFETG